MDSLLLSRSRGWELTLFWKSLKEGLGGKVGNSLYLTVLASGLKTTVDLYFFPGSGFITGVLVCFLRTHGLDLVNTRQQRVIIDSRSPEAHSSC